MVKPLDNINLQTILANQAKISVEKPAKGANSSEFADIIRAQVQSQENTDGTDATNGPRFSKHAQKRIAERNLDMDGDEFLKLKGAIDKLKTKGGKDSLVITSNPIMAGPFWRPSNRPVEVILHRNISLGGTNEYLTLF
jgi:hypothetical protein